MSSLSNLANISNIARLWSKGWQTLVTPFLQNFTTWVGISPSDSSVTYIGNWVWSSTLWATDVKIYPWISCRIDKIYWWVRNTVNGSSESATISVLVNWTTAYDITTSYSFASSNSFNSTNLWILLWPSDYICLRLTWPAWATNPTFVLNACALIEPLQKRTSYTYPIEFWHGTSSPAANSNHFIWDNIAATTSSARTYITKAWMLTQANIQIRCTAWWSQNVAYYIRVNNTTDYEISTTAQLNATNAEVSNLALSISLAEWDYFELKWVYPLWWTPATSITYTFNWLVQV